MSSPLSGKTTTSISPVRRSSVGRLGLSSLKCFGSARVSNSHALLLGLGLEYFSKAKQQTWVLQRGLMAYGGHLAQNVSEVKHKLVNVNTIQRDCYSFPNKIENSYLEGGVVHSTYFLFALTSVSIRDALVSYNFHKRKLCENLSAMESKKMMRDVLDTKKKMKYSTYSSLNALDRNLNQELEAAACKYLNLNGAMEKCEEFYKDCCSFYDSCYDGCAPAILRANYLLSRGRVEKVKTGMKMLEEYHSEILSKKKRTLLFNDKIEKELDEAEKFLSEAMCFENSYTKVSINEPELYKLDRMMQFSAIAYGWKSLYFLGLARWTNLTAMCGNRKATTTLTGLSDDNILVYEDKSEVFLPGHVVCIDHNTKNVVVSVRGTARFQDIITNLNCREKSIQLKDSDTKEIISGRTHEGFYKSAEAMCDSLSDKVLEAIDKNPGYSVAITGHSLGGAVACLLSLRWAQDPRFLKRDTHVNGYTFGSPGILCERLSQCDLVQKHVTSVVLGEDFVTRLSVGSFDKLIYTCLRLASLKEEKESYQGLYSNVDDEPLPASPDPANKDWNWKDKFLFPGGRVIRIPYATQCNDNFRVLMTQEIKNCSLSDILLSPKMCTAHLPSQYINGVRMQIKLKNNHVFRLL